MNKKKITIMVLNEFGDEIIIFGQFEIDDIQKMIDVAEKYDMPCLSLIEPLKDNYFNEIQCQDIEKELEILKKYSELNKEFLDTLYRATNTVIKCESYMKITRDEVS